MKVEDADSLQGHDGPDGFQARPVVGLLVLAVLNKLPRTKCPENYILKHKININSIHQPVLS